MKLDTHTEAGLEDITHQAKETCSSPGAGGLRKPGKQGQGQGQPPPPLPAPRVAGHRHTLLSTGQDTARQSTHPPKGCARSRASLGEHKRGMDTNFTVL